MLLLKQVHFRVIKFFNRLKKLPIIYVCENNFYSVYSPLKVRQPMSRKIHKMVGGVGLNSFLEMEI